MKKDDGLDDDCDNKNILPAVLGGFILSSSKRIMNILIREINGFHNNSLYYGDTDTLCMEKKYLDVLDKVNLVGEELFQGKNVYKTGGIFYGLFLGAKANYCLTMEYYGIIQEHKTFKGFNDSKRLSDRSQNFKKIEGKKYQLCYQDSGKNCLIAEYLRKRDFVMNVKMEYYVQRVIIKLMKIKNSKLI